MTTREDELPFSPSCSEFSPEGRKVKHGTSGSGGDQSSTKCSAWEASSREPSGSPLEALLSLSEIACGGSPKSLNPRRRPTNGESHKSAVLPELAPTRFFFQSVPLDERARQNSILQGADSTHSEALTQRV